MKKIGVTLFLASLFVFGCASSGRISSDMVSHEAERERARQGYDALEAETHPTPKGEVRAQAASYNQPMNSVQKVPRPAVLPVLMVLPAVSNLNETPQKVIAQNPFSKAAMEGINEYLSQNGYEVKSLEGNAELDELVAMQSEISGEEDISYAASLILGADVYIKYSGAVHNNMVTVELSAYETSTARLLGSKTGMVQNHGSKTENLRYLVHSAVKKAMVGLEKTILGYWQADLQDGVQYKVILRINGEAGTALEDLHESVISALRSRFSKVRINKATDKTIDLILYANAQEFSDAFSVYGAIRELLSPLASVQKNNIAQKLIMMELN